MDSSCTVLSPSNHLFAPVNRDRDEKRAPCPALNALANHGYM